MKAWADNHPKAKLIARKRAAILEAARNAFLRAGYEGASMEEIAAAAGVSIMTLYRHAQSKDDLFEAVVLNACRHTYDAQDADTAALMRLPLREVLVRVGNLFQDRLTSPETVSLFRTVMVETVRFPHLGEAAYRGLVDAWAVNLSRSLSDRPECRQIAAPARRALVAGFMDDLVGTAILRALFGLGTLSVRQRRRRSELAADRFEINLPR